MMDIHKTNLSTNLQCGAGIHRKCSLVPPGSSEAGAAVDVDDGAVDEPSLRRCLSPLTECFMLHSTSIFDRHLQTVLRLLTSHNPNYAINADVRGKMLLAHCIVAAARLSYQR